MLVKLLNSNPTHDPGGPATITTMSVAGDYTPHESAEILAGKFARHLATGTDITRLGDHSDDTGNHEAFLAVVRTWPHHGIGNPAGVWSDNPDFATLLAKFYDTTVVSDPEA